MPASCKSVSTLKRTEYDQSYPYARVGRGFYSSEQVVVHGIRRYSERTINNPAIDMNSEVNLEDIIVLEDHFFGPRIWRPMSSHVVEG